MDDVNGRVGGQVPSWTIAIVTFLLAFTTVASVIFLVVAFALSLWVGVFWYGVSAMFFGALLRGWVHSSGTP